MLNGAQLLERVRKYVDDTILPYMHADTLCFEFLTEAERELALTSRCLRRIMSYDIEADDQWLDLSDTPEIIEIRKATLTDSRGRKYPIKLCGTMDFPASTVTDYGMHIQRINTLPGRPTTLVVGQVNGSAMSLELSPISDDAYTIELSTVLYPDYPIDSTSSVPSIPERYHQSIAIGAGVRLLELDPHFDDNSRKIQTMQSAWQQALVRASRESGMIMRDASVVRFSNEYW